MRGKNGKERLCPECGASMHSGIRPFSFHGINLGEFEVLECPRCGEYGFTLKGSRAIDRVAKTRGMWGADLSRAVTTPHRPSTKGEVAIDT